MKKIMLSVLFFLSCEISHSKILLNPDSREILLDKDLKQNSARIKDYPIQICVGQLGYSPREIKTKDDPLCRKQKELPYEECMEKRLNRANYKKLLINKKYEIQPGEIVYLKRKKYSFLLGDQGLRRNFLNEEHSIFQIDTANYGGVTLNAVSKCKKLSSN